MISTDKTEFTQLWLTITHQYHYVFSQSFLEIYFHCLKDYSIVDIKSAFLSYFNTVDGKQFMPQPSDLLRILTGESSIQTALAAWAKVHQAIRCVSSYQSIVFDDFLIHAVINDIGGWITLCQKTGQELILIASEFQKRYRRYLRYRPYSYSNHLIGLFEHFNTSSQCTRSAYQLVKKVVKNIIQASVKAEKPSQPTSLSSTRSTYESK